MSNNIAPTLNTVDRHAVVTVDTLPFDTTQITSKQNRSNPQFGDPCHTLAAQADAPVIAFSAGQSAKAGSIAAQVELAPTLRAGSSGTNQVPTVCLTQYGQEIAGTLTARADSSPCVDRGQNVVCMGSANSKASVSNDVCPTMTARQYKDPPILFNGYIVRRLTPTECERLQGFPDGWTDLGDTPDTPRYKALGNSMAVPVMAWIGKRIQMVDEIDRKTK